METDYVTADTIKTMLSLTGTSYADADIAQAISTASRELDRLSQRHFYVDDDDEQVRYYSPDDQSELDIDDLVTLTTLQTDADGDGTFEQTWTLDTDFVLDPLNAQSNAADLRPYERICVHPAGSYVFPTVYPRTVKLTGKFGWPSVPDPIVTAASMLASQILTRNRSAPFGIISFDGGAIRIQRVDSGVMLAIGSYMKHRVGVA